MLVNFGLNNYAGIGGNLLVKSGLNSSAAKHPFQRSNSNYLLFKHPGTQEQAVSVPVEASVLCCWSLVWRTCG